MRLDGAAESSGRQCGERSGSVWVSPWVGSVAAASHMHVFDRVPPATRSSREAHRVRRPCWHQSHAYLRPPPPLHRPLGRRGAHRPPSPLRPCRHRRHQPHAILRPLASLQGTGHPPASSPLRACRPHQHQLLLQGGRRGRRRRARPTTGASPSSPPKPGGRPASSPRRPTRARRHHPHLHHRGRPPLSTTSSSGRPLAPSCPRCESTMAPLGPVRAP